MSRWMLAASLVLFGSGAALAESLVVLVRHAEKVDESRDPELTETGRERARALAVMLRDAGIEEIYSTDFIRTRETARPLAEALGIDVDLYEGGALAELAERLRSRDVRALVVGHSNTTPELVELLGGDPGAPIDEEEYDRLYVVLVPDGGAAVTTMLRFAP